MFISHPLLTSPSHLPVFPSRPLAAAAAYPFAIPGFSFVLEGGRLRRWAGKAGTRGAMAGRVGRVGRGRVPVIAWGSNRAPARLVRKFAVLPGAAVVPVIRARLHGFDVVYSAHFARYGALPATPHPAPGGWVEVSVLWLTGAQIRHLHGTESVGENYAFGCFSRLRLDMEHAVNGRRRLTRAFAYASLHGCLGADGMPVALAAIPAGRRRWPALDQRGALALVRDRLAPGCDLADFVAGNVANEGMRRAGTRALHGAARTAALPHFRVLAP